MQVGDNVDSFSSVDQNGETQTLDGLVANGPVVLYFYPKAMTPG